MRKNYFLFLSLLYSLLGYSQTVFINELHYDNTGGDKNEGIEIAGPAGTDLSTYKIEFYNGGNNMLYASKTLSGIIPNQQNNFGTLWFSKSNIQNGTNDGLALIKDNSVIQFLSYEGTLTAIDGAAKDLTSTDITVNETSSTPEGYALQLVGSGSLYSDFQWQAPSQATSGSINTNQLFSTATTHVVEFNKNSFLVYPNPVHNGQLSIKTPWPDAFKVEIYSILGKQVLKKLNVTNSLDVSKLKKGIYIINLRQNNKQLTKQLVIK